MALISKNEVVPAFRQYAFNSSHFVWLIGDFEYFESTQKIIFAFKKRGSTVFLALEPLGQIEDGEKFRSAWREFSLAVPHVLTVWVGIYSEFTQALQKLNYQTLKVGREPWLFLDEKGVAKGKVARGVRSAKNFAAYTGVSIEEWKYSELSPQSEKWLVIDQICRDWKAKRLVSLSGFLNATDPWVFSEYRRLFVAKNREGVIEGYLIATEIPKKSSYFFEDLMMKAHATKGVAELLILSAAEVLQKTGTQEVSLGVVSLSEMNKESAQGIDSLTQLFLLKIPTVLKKFYNFNGLEVFRKRFKPRVWSDIFLAVKRQDGKNAQFLDWMRALIGLIAVFRPRLQLNFLYFQAQLEKLVVKNPLSSFFLLFSSLIFWKVNHGGALSEHVLTKFGFSASAPIPEWFYRTITSDWLYYNRSHFLSCVLPMFILLRWGERSHRRWFLFALVGLISFFDDFIDFYAIEKPFHYFQPAMFHRMSLEKDVGSSLILFTLLGLQLCQIRKNRELYFVAIAVFLVLGITYSSSHHTALVLNLNHFIFLSLGYVIGKVEFEYYRRINNSLSKGRK